MLLLTVGLAEQAAASAKNFAAASVGARASSNGDFRDPAHADRVFPASAAINGNSNAEGFGEGNVWMSAEPASVDSPAIWQVGFRRPELVSRITITQWPEGQNQLVDFAVEFQSPRDQGYHRLVPREGAWANPVRGNGQKVLTLDFETVLAKALRLIITAASPDKVAQYGSGFAMIAEFEAMHVSFAEEASARKEKSLSELKALVQQWREQRAKREQQRLAERRKTDQAEEPAQVINWLKREKLLSGHTGLGDSGLFKHFPEWQQAIGMNSMDLSGWNFHTMRDWWEPRIKQLHEFFTKQEVRWTLWIPHYWYPKDMDAEGFHRRNCLEHITPDGPYRGAVNLQGLPTHHTPCPLAEEFWRSLRGQARQVALWSVKYPSIFGLCYDMEFYGTSSPRMYSGYYTYDHCFCDHCFDRFVRKVGSSLTSAAVRAERRFACLKRAGALVAYYESLGDEVRQRFEELRLMAHQINPDLILGLYGVPIWPIEDQATWAELEKRWVWKSWYGFAMAQGLGTKRMPCLSKPLDGYGTWDLDTWIVRGPGEPGSGMKDWHWAKIGMSIQQKMESLGLHALYVPGFVITDIETPEQYAGHLKLCLEKGHGCWINEWWMLWAFAEKPDSPRPGWWKQSDYEINDFVRAIRETLASVER